VLTPGELERYDRQLLIREMGQAGQEQLKKARIAIAGAGGLGSTVAIYLAAAGVGTIGLIDHDEVRLTNLNRQILYGTGDVGKKKVVSAAEKLKNLNPSTEIVAADRMITDKNVADLLSGFDGVVDALDNLETRFLLNKAALDHGIPLFHGAVRAFEGRVMTVIPGRTACLRCVYRGARTCVTWPAATKPWKPSAALSENASSSLSPDTPLSGNWSFTKMVSCRPLLRYT
jgi:molybdopterin/thiamine biosynthesis adenylyltransferase